MINTPSHVGTHIDILNKENIITLDRFRGWGVLIDISKYNELPITMSSIKNQHLVKKDDFVFFKTRWSKYIKKEIILIIRNYLLRFSSGLQKRELI
ncbi:MAG: cyclase family protein [Candidatus Methanofastidiosa archaeon]|nr:cyclase family protein [Candidatus Methanofastidiosa archaeon]